MKAHGRLKILGVPIFVTALLATACGQTAAPAAAPTQATGAAAQPTAAATQPAAQTAAPSAAPTVAPTKAPTLAPTSVPTKPPAPTRTAVPSRTPVPRTPTAAARATTQPTAQVARTTATTEATPVSLQAPAGATDCGSDLSCFIEASRAGSLAKVDYTMAVDFFGMFLANTDTLMIKAKNGNQLAFSQQTIAADAAMSEAVLAAAEAKGMSGPDIQKALTTAAGVADLMRAANANLTPEQGEQLKPAKESQQARIGTGKECQFPQSALTAMLERWKAGQYSSSDYDAAQCTDLGAPSSSTAPAKSGTAAPTRTPGPQPAIFGKNLIVNGDAETGASASTNTEKVPPSGWTATGNFTAIKYGSKGVLSAEVAQFENAGASFFAGGPNNALSSATQTIDVTEGAAAIDGGEVRFELGALLGGSGTQADSASVTLTFKGGDGKVLDTKTMGPPTPDDRNRVDGYMGFGASHYVPKGTRSIEVKVTMKGTNASSYNDGYADNITLSLVDEAA